MEKMIEKAMDLCFVIDLNPYKDNEELRGSFVYKMNSLLLFLSLLGPGYFISVYLLDGPFEDTFYKRSETDPDRMHALKHRYFNSLTPVKDCESVHSFHLYEQAENQVRQAQDKNPSVSFDTHSFYVTATPVTKCSVDKDGFDEFHEDSFRHLFLLGMSEEDAFMTAEDTGCDDFFLYDLNDDGVEECFDDVFHTVSAIHRQFSRTLISCGSEERKEVWLS